MPFLARLSSLLISLFPGVKEVCLEVGGQSIVENEMLGGSDVMVLLNVDARVMSLCGGRRI
jgi:hypothetical protein